MHFFGGGGGGGSLFEPEHYKCNMVGKTIFRKLLYPVRVKLIGFVPCYNFNTILRKKKILSSQNDQNTT